MGNWKVDEDKLSVVCLILSLQSWKEIFLKNNYQMAVVWTIKVKIWKIRQKTNLIIYFVIKIEYNNKYYHASE